MNYTLRQAETTCCDCTHTTGNRLLGECNEDRGHKLCVQYLTGRVLYVQSPFCTLSKKLLLWVCLVDKCRPRAALSNSKGWDSGTHVHM